MCLTSCLSICPLPPPEPTPQSMQCMDQFAATVATHYGVDASWFLNAQRTRTRSRCRQMVMALANRYTTLSGREIAEYFGMDHKSVEAAVRNVKTKRREEFDALCVVYERRMRYL